MQGVNGFCCRGFDAVCDENMPAVCTIDSHMNNSPDTVTVRTGDKVTVHQFFITAQYLLSVNDGANAFSGDLFCI